MLIVPKNEFIRMPAGTIFAPWRPNAFMDEFEIKVDGGDGERYNGTMPLTPWLEDGVGPGQNDVDFEVYDGDQNDISEYEWIAVLEEKDVRNLINKLVWALRGCPDEEVKKSKGSDPWDPRNLDPYVIDRLAAIADAPRRAAAKLYGPVNPFNF